MAAPTHRVTRATYADGRIVTQNKTFTGSQELYTEETIPAGNDTAVVVSIDVSALKSLMLASTQDVTIETNNSASGVCDDTIYLTANVPYSWTEDDAYSPPDASAPCLLTTDVTVMYVSNASGSSATLTIQQLVDATP